MELAKAVSDQADRSDDAGYETRLAELNAHIEKLVAHGKTNDAAYEKQIAELKNQLGKSQAESTKAAADEKAGGDAYEKRIAELKSQVAKSAAADKAGAAAYEKRLAQLQEQLTASRAEFTQAQSRWITGLSDLETKLKAAESKKTIVGDIERIEGIGPAYGQKLRSIGLAWVRELLDHGADPNGRQRIAAETGIKPELILAWVNAADLLRVDGVTPDWAELLEASGVDTVKELKNRVPANLLAKLTETNPTGPRGRIAPSLPDLEEVEGWVAQAKAMRPRMSH